MMVVVVAAIVEFFFFFSFHKNGIAMGFDFRDGF